MIDKDAVEFFRGLLRQEISVILATGQDSEERLNCLEKADKALSDYVTLEPLRRESYRLPQVPNSDDGQSPLFRPEDT